MSLTGLGSGFLISSRVFARASFVLSLGAAKVVWDIFLLYSARFGQASSITYWGLNGVTLASFCRSETCVLLVARDRKLNTKPA